MAYTLVGNCYIGTGSLPTPVAGYDAVDTNTGNKYSSNTSSTSWTLIGNVNQTQNGNLPLTGGTMTGAILGATGWAPLASPNFTSSAKRDSIDLATVNDLTDMQTAILSSVTPKITEAVASTTSAISVASKIAFGHGVLEFAGGGIPAVQTIPLPYYPGNVQAAESECIWMISVIRGYWPTGSATYNTYLRCKDTSNADVDPTSTRTFKMYTEVTNGTYNAVSIAYTIIGVKA
jgi:hypothetical protein